MLREVLFKRSQYDTLDKHYIELNVLLKDTFFKVGFSGWCFDSPTACTAL